MESRHQVIETVAKQVKRKQIQRVSQLDVVNVTFSYEKPQRIYVTRTSSLARKWARLLSPCVRLFTKKQLLNSFHMLWFFCFVISVWFEKTSYKHVSLSCRIEQCNCLFICHFPTGGNYYTHTNPRRGSTLLISSCGFLLFFFFSDVRRFRCCGAVRSAET